MWLATRIRIRFSLPAVLLSLMLAGCQSLGLARYSQYMLGEIPDQYTERRNPFLEMSENILIARQLYQDHCSSCHGVKGKGDGGLSSEVSPRPANLTLTRRLPIATDAFFFWTISEGGEAFGTAMPSFAKSLSEEEIWQIINYVKNDL